MYRLRNKIQTYAWGSHSAIAKLQGRPFPTPDPEAELWMGAHPAAPSFLVDADHSTQPLDEALAKNPRQVVGVDVWEAYGSRFPYLVKMLGIDSPLSIQVHPTAAQAREGFVRESTAGVPVEAPSRNYVDVSHKPELLVALEQCDVLCGFRPVEDIIAGMRELAIVELEEYISILQGKDGIQRAVSQVLTSPSVGLLSRMVGDASKQRVGMAQGSLNPWISQIAERYPGDAGVVVALFLQHRQLRKNEGIFVPAGVLHAYLRGVGVEVMANSDNVLRAGLTPKHVDVPEVLKIVQWQSQPLLVEASPVSAGVSEWRTPAEEFTLCQVLLQGEQCTVPLVGPRIFFCTQGMVGLQGSVGGSVQLRPGESAFAPASDGVVSSVGEGVFFAVAPAPLS